MKITFRIWLLIISIVLSLIAIFSIPPIFLQSGVVVTAVHQNSTVFSDGLREGMIIQRINGKEIKSVQDYINIMKPMNNLGENETAKLDIKTKKHEFIDLFKKSIVGDISVEPIPNTRIQTGLDLRGGVRAFIAASVPITDSQLDDLISISEQRLNVYGLSDVKFFKIKESSGKRLMEVEIAGSSPSNLEQLIAKQGKFVAKIGNQTVFVGGHKDITYVGRSGQDALITDCFASGGKQVCTFRFTIYLSEKAAQRHAKITSHLTINGSYLSKKLDFYIDGKKTSSLNIGAGLKGSATTEISISGSGSGTDRNAAIKDAKLQMKKLQTILITGSLPFKLKIVKIDKISPNLGFGFVKQILMAAIFAFVAVFLVILIRYRNLKISFAVMATSISEVLIILGIAVVIGQNLDLPAIAGIVAAIGTGVDDQVVILDESRSKYDSVLQRIKTALFIIMTSFATTVVAMLPLTGFLGFMGIGAASAGLLKGFAVTTILGISAGVFITRPAFADIARQIEEKSEI